MGYTLNAKTFIRYKTIDACLQANSELTGEDTHEPLTIEKLIEACRQAYVNHEIDSNINRTWVYNDIKFLKESAEGPKAPIISTKLSKNSNYKYAVANYSIFNSEWFKQQLIAKATEFYKIYEPQKVRNAEQLIKFFDTLIGEASDYAINRQIVFFSNDPHPGWTDSFSAIYRAILSKNALRIKYVSYSGEKVDEVFHPQIIKEFNKTYYAVGLDNEAGLKVYPLDRLKSYEKSNSSYLEDNRDWSDYFDETVGVTRYEDVQLEFVHLRIKKPRAFYFKSKSIISSKINSTESDSYIDFTFSVYPNLELENVIMTYLPDCEIIAPQSLKDSIKHRLLKSLE